MLLNIRDTVSDIVCHNIYKLFLFALILFHFKYLQHCHLIIVVSVWRGFGRMALSVS